MLTQVMEWHLKLIVMDFVFGETDGGKETGVRKDFLKDVQRNQLAAGLRRRMYLMGLLNLVLSPFILVFLVVYFFFKYGEVRLCL